MIFAQDEATPRQIERVFLATILVTLAEATSSASAETRGYNKVMDRIYRVAED
jgi:hypothetical protein